MGYLSCRAQSSVSTSDTQTAVQPNLFLYTDLESATNGFSDHNLLGKGSHGSVYKALLRGRHVAVKRPSRSHLPHQTLTSSFHELDNEIQILSQLRSPRFVNLVGFTSEPPNRRLLVVEFMTNGTLYDALHSNPKPLNWSTRVKFALQIAKAIEALHGFDPPVIHRDVKSANVLIDRSFDARLGDFGLAIRCHVDDLRVKSTPPAGTIGYLDPNYVSPGNLSTKLDVFSFGILVLEMISGRKAIDVAHSPPSIVDWAVPLIKRGKLGAVFDPRLGPPRDGLVARQLAVIAAKCVRPCAERRPAMGDVARWLDGLRKLGPVGGGWANPCVGPGSVAPSIDVARDVRRVYSDLGFRSNLMELMTVGDEDDVAGARIKRNGSIGGSSKMICSRIDDVVIRGGSFRSQS